MTAVALNCLSGLTSKRAILTNTTPMLKTCRLCWPGLNGFELSSWKQAKSGSQSWPTPPNGLLRPRVRSEVRQEGTFKLCGETDVQTRNESVSPTPRYGSDRVRRARSGEGATPTQYRSIDAELFDPH